jgi:hypothetical protein
MAYVPGCRHDVFISYASENNRDGWVEQFDKALRQELSELIGRQFSHKDSIFLDKRKLRVGQSFPDELKAAARESAILVPILSPHFLTSPWCNQERVEFFRKLPYGAEAAQCLAPILIRPISENEMLPLYRNGHRFSLLAEDEQGPLSPGSPQWIPKLRQFAGQLKEALQLLRHTCKPIFLGKVANDGRWAKLRESCQRELEKGYFRTVPENIYALDDPDTTHANLQAAGLAVHFLGGSDAASREAIKTSMNTCEGLTVLFQPRWANLTPDEKVWLEGFERSVWPAPGHYQWLAGKNNRELLALINEQMKLVLIESDGNVARADLALTWGEAGIAKANLALICGEADLDGARQFQAEMKTQHRIQVELPDFFEQRLTAMERWRKWHAYRSYVGNMKAILFYYGASKRNWLELMWEKAENDWPNVRRRWFLVQPNLDRKREQYPDALWQIDQVIGFLGPDPERNTQ